MRVTRRALRTAGLDERAAVKLISFHRTRTTLTQCFTRWQSISLNKGLTFAPQLGAMLATRGRLSQNSPAAFLPAKPQTYDSDQASEKENGSTGGTNCRGPLEVKDQFSEEQTTKTIFEQRADDTQHPPAGAAKQPLADQDARLNLTHDNVTRRRQRTGTCAMEPMGIDEAFALWVQATQALKKERTESCTDHCKTQPDHPSHPLQQLSHQIAKVVTSLKKKLTHSIQHHFRDRTCSRTYSASTHCTSDKGQGSLEETSPAEASTAPPAITAENDTITWKQKVSTPLSLPQGALA
eukprot:scaffold1629_cov369-Prasinococcus_capsulatus_cf.AAC.29